MQNSSRMQSAPDANVSSREAKESLLPPPLVGRFAEGAPSPLLFAPQPTLEFEDNASIDLAEVPRAVELTIILTPAAQCRVEVLNHLTERSPYISVEFLANSLPHVLHRLSGGKPITEHPGSQASGRLAHKMHTEKVEPRPRPRLFASFLPTTEA
jgi:hypothetical protein